MKLWDIETWQCFYTIDWFDDSISACFNPDGTQILLNHKGKTYIYDIDYDLHFPGWDDWNEGARSYLDIFLTLHPNWTDDDFKILITELQNRGYGWLRPEGVNTKLLELSNKKTEF